MDTEYLREFLTVADELSFTQAASKLHITQSTLSKHIAALEKEFQDNLFVRSKRGLEITQAGGILYRQAISILSLLETTHEKIQAIRTKAPIRISGLVENNDIMVMLSQAIHAYQSSAEQQILLTPASSKSFIDLLCDVDIDLAICHRSLKGDENPEIGHVELFKANMIAFVEASHRLADRSSVSLAELKDELFVHLTSPYAEYGWSNVVSACKAHGFTPRSYPVDEQGIANCFILPLEDSVLVLQEGIVSSSMLSNNHYVGLRIEDADALFSNCAYYRKSDEKSLRPLLECLGSSVEPEINDNSQAQIQTDSSQLKLACSKIADQYSLSENELIAMTDYVQGMSIDYLCEKLKLSRVNVGDLLASVYAKTGVSNRQGLMEAITTLAL